MKKKLVKKYQSAGEVRATKRDSIYNAAAEKTKARFNLKAMLADTAVVAPSAGKEVSVIGKSGKKITMKPSKKSGGAFNAYAKKRK